MIYMRAVVNGLLLFEEFNLEDVKTDAPILYFIFKKGKIVISKVKFSDVGKYDILLSF